MNKNNLLIFVLFFCSSTLKTFSQEHHPEPETKLEMEQELYPVDLVNLYSNLIKVETLIDLYKRNSINYGLRSFVNTNYHTKGDTFNDMVMYTQSYVGKGFFAMGAEIGSIAKKDYISFGPQMVIYDKWGFERLSIHTRIWPKYILGAEYTTIEWKEKLSSTGMFRYIPQTGQFIGQASVWYTLNQHFNFGIEYEFNNSKIHHEESEIFIGTKFFFSK